MKRSGELIGRPIISLVDGCEIGTVKSFVFNPGDGIVAAIVVDDGKSYRGAKLIAFGDILGIGASAITIEQKSFVKSVEEAPELEKLLEANVNIINTKILTKKGEIKGTITEVKFDTETGQIIECYSVNENGDSFIIPADKIYTYGSGITVITSEDDIPATKAVVSPKSEQPKAAFQQPQQGKVEQPKVVIQTPVVEKQPEPKKLEQPKVVIQTPIVEKQPEPKKLEQPKVVIQNPIVEKQTKSIQQPIVEKVQETTPVEEVKTQEQPVVEEIKEVVNEVQENVEDIKTEELPVEKQQKILEQPKVEDSVDIQTDEAAADSIKAMRKFEERQKKFLIGKKATRRIVTDNGTEIINQGEEVTKEIIQKANLAGKFVELSMSVQ